MGCMNTSVMQLDGKIFLLVTAMTTNRREMLWDANNKSKSKNT